MRTARAARSVRQPLAFILAETFMRGGEPRPWRLRDGSGTVFLRSGTGDFDIFEEIFRARAYTPPRAVRALLGDAPRIADLGANVGLFSAWALSEFPGARTRLFEPDPANLAVLRECIAASPDPAAWDLRPAAAGTAAGTLAFRSGKFQHSRAATGEEAPEDVVEVPVIDVFELLGDADLVKIDIEGGEWPILGDERLARIPAKAVVLEYHRRPEMPPGEPPQVAEDLLRAAGFDQIEHRFWNPPWVGELWAWRSASS